MSERTASNFFFKLLVALCALVFVTSAHAQTQRTRPRTTTAQPPRTTPRATQQNNAQSPDASNAQSSTTSSAQSSSTAAAPSPSVPEEDADLVIIANVTAKELRFDAVPNPTVVFPGQPKRDTEWSAERTNLPPQVQPGVTYRDIGIRLKIVSRFADIDRIVAEALGEIPKSDDTTTTATTTTTTTNNVAPPTTVSDATPTTRANATDSTRASGARQATQTRKPAPRATRRTR